MGQRDAPGAQRKTDPASTIVLVQERLYAECRAVIGADRPPPVLIRVLHVGRAMECAPRCTSPLDPVVSALCLDTTI